MSSESSFTKRSARLRGLDDVPDRELGQVHAVLLRGLVEAVLADRAERARGDLHLVSSAAVEPLWTRTPQTGCRSRQ